MIRSDIVNNVTEEVQNSLEQRKKHALFYKCAAAWGLNRPFHGRPQPSNLDDVFSQAQRLVQEVHRILNGRGPSEGDVEYCIARLETLLQNCVHLHGVPPNEQYNEPNASIQNYIHKLRSLMNNLTEQEVSLITRLSQYRLASDGHGMM